CSIGAAEPDLAITRLSLALGSPVRTTALYFVRIRNAGAAAAGPFAVAFAVGGTPLADQQVVGLAPRASTTVEFSGPRCTAGQTLTATVDPSGAITEPANQSRAVSLACPSPAGGGGGGVTGRTGAS
ncbi:MAG TPA: CARDB domain-containing protein, partial [Solirubrobacteraceae bacterium]|nr:CARDB domain-containing protein [Solirubrobacteraceae bacterium]